MKGYSMREKVIIAIVGKKRSGKDTVGDYLRNNYALKPAQKLAYPIKQIAKMLFNWTDEMVEGIDYDREQQIEELGMSVRQFLQECGSLFKYELSRLIPSYGEKVGVSIWAKILVKWLEEREGIFYVTDVRFPEEVSELKNNFKNTFVIKLISDRSPNDTHISETSVDLITADYDIENNGWNTQDELYSKLDSVLVDIFIKTRRKEYEDSSN